MTYYFKCDNCGINMITFKSIRIKGETYNLCDKCIKEAIKFKDKIEGKLMKKEKVLMTIDDIDEYKTFIDGFNGSFWGKLKCVE